MDTFKEWQTRNGPPSAGVDTTKKKKDWKLDGWNESRMQWQGEEGKDSGLIGTNGDWESEDVSDIKKPIYTYT